MLAASSSTTVILGTISQFILGNFLHWRKVALVNTFVPVAALISLLLIPESPHWLISKIQLLVEYIKYVFVLILLCDTFELLFNNNV